ncbi:MAG: Ig-like domain-containing protein [Lachnospiraceae bacterium]|nr:Ig-like domain-containing protein [Lachnospiraceae bacterium]
MKIKNRFILCSLIALLIICSIVGQSRSSSAATPSFVILNTYYQSLNIGDEFWLVAFSSDGSIPKFKSSNSSIASVNTYGLVRAKKAGTTRITAKFKNGEASCKVTVKKTKITLNATRVSLERKQTFQIKATTSNGHEVTFKSNKTSVATVSSTGKVTACKPGEARITIKADGTVANFKVTVKKPTLRLSQTSAYLYHGQKLRLVCTTSSGIPVTWKSGKKSVAVVSDTGEVTALKHGEALITAQLDGVSKTCLLTVRKPQIKLSKTKATIKIGSSLTLTAKSSTGQMPDWSSSNSKIATVDSSGKIHALKKGRATISATEDGTKETCLITVTE